MTSKSRRPRTGALALTALVATTLTSGCYPVVTPPQPMESHSTAPEPAPSTLPEEETAARPVATPSQTASTSASPSVTPTPSTTPTPTASPSASTTPTASALPSSSPSRAQEMVAADAEPATPSRRPAATGAIGDLGLPMVPWEGGPQYWAKYPNANASGWSKDDHFPIAIWWGGVSTDEEVQHDKALGINTYVEMDPSTKYELFERNDVYWIGPKLNSSFTDQSTHWVGNFMDDEVDGRFEPAEGLARMRASREAGKKTPRFNYANFTGMVVSSHFDYGDDYLALTDAASMDMYWYTVPYCDWDNHREDYYIFPVKKAHCRTSSSYGQVMNGMREQDAKDGHLQPLWNFIEMADPTLPDTASRGPIRPEQLKGAAMSSVINEARGLIYYNQDYKACHNGNLIRRAQLDRNFCAKEQVKAMGEVNNFIQSLAPVLNTQSHEWDFGKGLDTMLKTKDGSAYVFAMVDGTDHAGSRTFTLPEQLKGHRIEVVGENRTITPNADGTFTDHFAAEYTYHVYKIG
ncbi:hypothetical protein ACTQ49_07115 [Luteococcus sp. Sow4_B9]|uniref:hypothetical protein n=1 Tax=Luteococcus sp. Sow4_B9 TaxID=3438792 RepID=UPI003F9A2C01